jgi:hypothetical protein
LSSLWSFWNEQKKDRRCIVCHKCLHELTLKYKCISFSQEERASKVRYLGVLITSPDFESDDISAVFNVLQHGHQIRSLKFTYSNYRDLPIHIQLPVGVYEGRLKNLVELTLSVPIMLLPDLKVKELHLPALRYMTYQSEPFLRHLHPPLPTSNFRRTVFDYLVPLLNRHAGQLRELSLSINRIWFDNIIPHLCEGLHGIESLRRLDLEGHSFAVLSATGADRRSELERSFRKLIEVNASTLEDLSLPSPPPSSLPRTRPYRMHDWLSSPVDGQVALVLKLKSLKIGVGFPLDDAFFSLVTSSTPHLHTLWISNSCFDKVTLSRFLTIAEEHGGDLAMKNLLLYLDPSIIDFLRELAKVFRSLKALRLRIDELPPCETLSSHDMDMVSIHLAPKSGCGILTLNDFKVIDVCVRSAYENIAAAQPSDTWPQDLFSVDLPGQRNTYVIYWDNAEYIWPPGFKQ